MRIVVNDASILIDLIRLELLPEFFSQEYEFITTILIVEELREEQFEKLSKYIEDKILLVVDLSETDLTEISRINIERRSLSIQDCSAFYQAKQISGALLTSDNRLRNFAKEKGVETHGHLWVLDQLFEKGILLGKVACNKLNDLCETINPKLGLPKSECERLIKKWTAR
ncbi:MAG TPA: hypothetical protein P5550_07965 [Bacteroidales bacterium]|nr:hypothetical protein [Bacteroidales bacterium]HRZ76566.1 hypothetical protein [Bacteroidales bacterium]